jgi:hypothetical protein
MNEYEKSMNRREEKENFISKKFNKLLRDVKYGPMSEIQNKIKKKEYAKLAEKAI